MTTPVRRALAAALVGLAGCAVGVFVDPRQALTSYLFAYAAALTLVVGVLMQCLISDVTGARWFDALRPDAERVLRVLPVLAVLAVPVLAGTHRLYPWSTPAALPEELRAVVERKRAWLNTPFFVGRGAGYLAAWLVVWRAVGARSGRGRGASAAALIASGLALTFAAFDWLMSLEPAWYSTVYGVYLFAGAALSALGVLVALRYGRAAVDDSDAERVAAAGKMLLAYALFWAYIAFAQYLIVWLADVPADVAWYAGRTRGGWAVLASAVGVAQFAVPLALLLSRRVNRDPRRLARIGAAVAAVHVLDVYWLVLPALHPEGLRPTWLDAAALLLVGGAVVARFAAARSADASPRDRHAALSSRGYGVPPAPPRHARSRQ